MTNPASKIDGLIESLKRIYAESDRSLLNPTREVLFQDVLVSLKRLRSDLAAGSAYALPVESTAPAAPMEPMAPMKGGGDGKQ